jgi:hypothetical protein
VDLIDKSQSKHTTTANFNKNVYFQLPDKYTMLTEINPKLPMRDKAVTKDYYVNKLGFQLFGDNDFDGYLMVQKDNVQIHFFEFKNLDIEANYGQVYIRSNDIAKIYQTFLDNKVSIHPNGHLVTKPWGQMEFSLLDPDNNLLTFGQRII